MEEIRIERNGYPLIGSLKQVLYELLDFTVDVRYSPLGVIKQNIEHIVELLQQYCLLKRQWADRIKNGSERRKEKMKHSQFIKFLQKLKENISKITDLARLQKTYYEYMMSLQELGPLRGYSVGSRFGDDLHINPELESMLGRSKGRF